MGNVGRDYFKENYGHCKDPVFCGSKKGCLDRDNVWLGTLCPNWVPTQAGSWDELMEIARGKYKTDKGPEGLADTPAAGKSRQESKDGGRS